MTLNDQMPELPDWPFIEVMKEGTLVVHGKHISYGRFLIARYALLIGALVYFYYAGKAAILERKIIPGLMEMMIVQLVPYLFIVNLLPVAKWLCWLFLRTRTKVAFTPEAVIIRGVKYATNRGVEIRFGAFEPVLKERQIQGEHNPRQALYMARFQKIQMVYGLKIVDITSIDDEYRAQQFAVILQQAYYFSRNDEERARLADGEGA